MTKKELLDKMAKDGGLTIKAADEALELVVNALKDSIRDGGTIPIRGFGTFSLKSVPARECRNPKTGEKIKVPAKQRPLWKPSKDFLGD